MLSLESQREAVGRVTAVQQDIQIVEVFEEARSAKTPGRPVFAAMLAKIEAGEADGIISWAPDRLARNSIDGGRIIYLLDTGTLRDLKFATYTFENNSQGKFMLSIMFGQSKYYSDALSENVKRGNRTKLERGWRPNRAPLGYRNNPLNKTIEPDSVHFALIQRMFRMALYEGYNPRQIVRIARDDWGFLTPRWRKSGGTPLGRTTIYRILSNPFYMGIIEWDGETYPGSHQPMVTPEEFAQLQAKLRAHSAPRAARIPFAYTGLMRCGSCGNMITAETKRRPSRTYVYYHCTARSALRGSCREPSVRAEVLDQEFLEFLSALRISPDIEEWARGFALTSQTASEQEQAAKDASRLAAVEELNAQAAELTSLRVRRMITDQEFVEAKRELDARRAAVQSAPLKSQQNPIEQLELVILARRYALDWFRKAGNHEKRILLKIVGSNIALTAKKVSIQAAKPFFATPKNDECPRLRGVVNANRKTATTVQLEYSAPKAPAARATESQAKALVDAIDAELSTPEGRVRLEMLRGLAERLGHWPIEAASKEAPSTPAVASRRPSLRRAKVVRRRCAP